MRLLATPRTVSSWNRAHTGPTAASILYTVLMLTSATRLIDRIDEPSHSMERIWTRLVRGSLFMPLLCEPFCFSSSMIVHYAVDLFQQRPISARVGVTDRLGTGDLPL